MSERDIITIEQRQPLALGTIQTAGPLALIGQATAIAEELAKIIRSRNLANRIQGREFVRVEGWSTLGAMLGVLPREVETVRQEDGGYTATVELVRISDGAVIGRASALVGMDEKDRNGNLTWANRAEYARRSMAVTRATGKAYRLGFSWIMTLAGYEPTPAEEMVDVEAESPTPPEPPPHWIKNEAIRKRFWAWATGDSENSLGLTNEQVHTALGVEHVEQFTGTMQEAKAKILGWIDEQIDNEPVNGEVITEAA